MALITGYDCSLTIGSNVFDTVINGFELSYDTETLTYDTLAGPRAAGGSESGSLSITFAYDSGDSPSLFDELWTQAGQPITYDAKVGASKFTGTAIAVRPGTPATAGSITEVSVELGLDGMPTKAASVVVKTNNP